MSGTDDALLRLLEEFPEVPVVPQFDDYGMPKADPAEWDPLLLAIESSVDEGGWDQIPRLWAIASPAYTAQMLTDTPQVHEALARQADAGGSFPPVLQAVVPFGEVGGYPVAELVGVQAPSWASAVVMSFEGWTLHGKLLPDGSRAAVDNPEGLAPSVHPERVEARSVIMVTRSGLVRAVFRVRGEDAVPEPDGHVHDGFLVDVLRRVVGVDVDGDGLGVPQYLRRLFLGLLAGYVHRSLVDPPTEDMPSAVAEEVRRIQAAAAAMPEGERYQVGATLVGAALTQTLARVTYMASNKGKRGFDRSLGRVVHDAYRGRAAADGVDGLRQVCEAAAQVANLTWEQVATAGPLSATFGPLAGKFTWAAEGLTAKWACYRELNDDEHSLEVITALAGEDAAGLLRQTLDAIGWRAPRPRQRSSGDPTAQRPAEPGSSAAQ